MKILVTAIGSVSALFVIKTIKSMNMGVIGVDIYPKSWIASASEVDFFHQIPNVSQSELYQEKILELCDIYKIRMIIPLTDIEVDYYSNNIDDFSRRGIIVTVSPKEVIDVLRDKLKIRETLLTSEIDTIPTYRYKDYLKSCGKFPCVAKKINGRSSEGLFVLESANELNAKLLDTRDYVFQPFILGDIITVDIIKANKNNKSYHISRRELLRTKNGLGLTVEIIQNKKLSLILEEFSNMIDYKGCINLEFIQSGSTFFLMDVNPRFSGGVAFSNIAGYNFVENHILYFLGQKINGIKKRNIQYGTIITRKYSEVVV